MEQTKGLLASKTVWGGILVVVGAVAGLLGYNFGVEDQASVAAAIDNIIVAVGGLLAIWGRIKATKRIA